MNIPKFLSSIVLLSGGSGVMAQKVVLPQVKISNEQNAQPMQLQELSVDILVVGQTAVTTMDMSFYNPNTRVMEGEFEFPLAPGQEVSRFALDINDKLREGVVVDKALGRKAFEEIIRRRVDPGLLEKTEGNNFRARVYPMPAEGSRRILIAFEQELSQKDGQDFYFLPIASAVELKKFKLRTEVVSRFVKANIANSLQLDFKQSRNSYISEIEQSNYRLDKNIALTFPKIEKPQLLAGFQGNKGYLYGNVRLKEQPLRRKEKPKHLGILWDNSSSSSRRDLSKEYDFLDAYFKELQNTEVELTTFNIVASKPVTFKVSNGNWQALRSYLEQLPYDGATSGNALKINRENDETLLFSDGIFNFGDAPFDLKKFVQGKRHPISVVSSNVVANADKLQYLAATTGGSFINLVSEEIPQAVRNICHQPYQFLGYEVKKGAVAHLFPEKGAVVGENFTFSGRIETEEVTLLLSFGYPNDVKEQKEVVFKINNDLSGEEFQLLRRIWAEKWIAQLKREGTPSKEIDDIGRQFGIVTEGNSLIVLETAADYALYKITPPKELEKEYLKIIAREEGEKKHNKGKSLSQVIAQSQEQTKWWNTLYPIKKKKEKETTDGLMESPIYVGEIDSGADRASSREAIATQNAPATGNRPIALRAQVASNAAARQPSSERSVVVPAEPVASIVLNDYNPDTPYLKVMEYAEDAKAMATYYKLKKEYGETPSFYVDVADYFFKKGNVAQAVLVVSNLAELRLEDAQLLRMLGYKLSHYGAKKEAIEVFRKVAEIREEEPQSFRDLGLALAEDKQFEEAVKTLYKVVTGSWSERFGDVQLVTMNDINSLLAREKGINTSFINKKLLKREPVDVRVVLSWDTDNCDMDLWVTDPEGEKCFFENRLTYLGGKISTDVTQGYGPEEFMLKKAVKGKYKVAVNYFGTSSQKQLLPVSLRITFYTHFGTAQEKKEEVTVRINVRKDVIEVGSFEFK